MRPAHEPSGELFGRQMWLRAKGRPFCTWEWQLFSVAPMRKNPIQGKEKRGNATKVKASANEYMRREEERGGEEGSGNSRKAERSISMWI